MRNNLKKYIFILALFLGTLNPIYASDVKFVQITDVNFSSDKATSFDKVIQDVNSIKKLDFVVFTGDNISVPNEENLKAFLKSVKKLNCPYYITLGNQDVAYHQKLSKKKYMKMVGSSKPFSHSSKPEYVFKKKGYVFIVTDGTKEYIPAPNGYYTEQELQRLEKTLEKYKDKEVIILQHYPLIENLASPNLNTYNRKSYLELLKKYPDVLAVVSGHYQYNQEELMNGIYHVISPSLSKQSQYKIIDIMESSNKSVIYTQLRTLNN